MRLTMTVLGLFVACSLSEGIAQAQVQFWRDPCYYSTSGTQNFVKFADLDGDGDLDMVVSHRHETRMAVLLNQSDGSFGSENLYPVGADPTDATFADFNGDSYLDVAVVTQVPSSVQILYGDGMGGLGVPVPLSPAPGPAVACVLAVDCNDDGAPDLVVGNSVTGNSHLLFYEGDGMGGFTLTDDEAYGDRGCYLGAHDFDQDGHIDVAVASSNGSHVTVMLGAGDCTFDPGSPIDAGFFGLLGMELGYINDDAFMDIVVGSNNSHGYAVYLGDGSGGFAVTTVTVDGWVLPGSPALGDVDEDGDLDLVIADYGASLVYVLLGDNSGTFVLADTFDHTQGGGGGAARLVDLDGDAELDLALALDSQLVAVHLDAPFAPCESCDFAESFDSENSLDDGFWVPEGAFTLIPDGAGGYVARGYAEGEDDPVLLVSDPWASSWSDPLIRFEAEMNSNDAYGYIRAYFCVPPGDPFVHPQLWEWGASHSPVSGYGVSLAAQQDSVWLYRYEDGVAYTIARGSLVVDSGVCYSVEMGRFGPEIGVRVDGELVVSAEDETYTYGTAAFSASTGGGSWTWVELLVDSICIDTPIAVTSVESVDGLPSNTSTIELASWPNPFGAETSIRFALPHAARSYIQVFDASGRVVRTLLDRRLEAGLHDLRWDGRDEAGRRVPAGAYWVHFSNGLVHRSHPMRLVR